MWVKCVNEALIVPEYWKFLLNHCFGFMVHKARTSGALTAGESDISAES